MTHDLIRALYKKLLRLYPQGFRERMGTSMEQTFNDLYRERRQTRQAVFGFLLWTFLDTAVGICREYLWLISPGEIMQTILKTFGSSVLLSFVLILPFMIMEVVNRRNFNEGFPFVLFFVMWLNLFAISLIVLPILRARWMGNQGVANHALAQGNALFTNPRRAAVISVLLFLSPGVLPLLDAVGWLSLDRLFNGPNSDVAYLPGQLLLLGLILFPIAAGIVAGQPIVSTLRAGGSLFAYPFHLFIVVGISFLFAVGVAGLIVDQWPCFIGVPNCD